MAKRAIRFVDPRDRRPFRVPIPSRAELQQELQPEPEAEPEPGRELSPLDAAGQGTAALAAGQEAVLPTSPRHPH